jgi:hypothetical protein
MQEQDLRVHGSIFYLLKKFVVHIYSEEMWLQFLREAKPSTEEFLMTENYPISDIEGIVITASKHSGFTIDQLQEKFGEWLVPDLFSVYKSYLRPEWRTFEVIENTEEVMHGAVRKLNSTANPPILHVSKVNENLLIVDYYSKRKMGSLAVGIIKGIAKYYNEQDLIKVVPTTNPEDERVQIKIQRN